MTAGRSRAWMRSVDATPDLSATRCVSHTMEGHNRLEPRGCGRSSVVTPHPARKTRVKRYPAWNYHLPSHTFVAFVTHVCHTFGEAGADRNADNALMRLSERHLKRSWKDLSVFALHLDSNDPGDVDDVARALINDLETLTGLRALTRSVVPPRALLTAPKR